MVKYYVLMFWMMLNQGSAQNLAGSDMGFDFMGTPGSFIHLNNFQENRPTGYFHFRLKYDEVKGSPYWFSEKSEASLEMNNGNFVTKVPIQYDAYSEEIIATQKDVGEFLIDTRYFQSMLLERDGRIVPFLKIHPDKPKKFVEVLYESEELFFFKDVHISYNIQEIRVTGFLDEIKRFRRQDLYYILVDGRLTKVKLKKKDILEALPYRMRAQLMNYLKANKRKLNSEDVIAEVLHRATMASVNREKPKDGMILAKTSTANNRNRATTGSNIRLQPETYRKLQELAAEKNKSVEEIIEEFVNSMFEVRNTPENKN